MAIFPTEREEQWWLANRSRIDDPDITVWTPLLLASPNWVEAHNETGITWAKEHGLEPDPLGRYWLNVTLEEITEEAENHNLKLDRDGYAVCDDCESVIVPLRFSREEHADGFYCGDCYRDLALHETTPWWTRARYPDDPAYWGEQPEPEYAKIRDEAIALDEAVLREIGL